MLTSQCRVLLYNDKLSDVILLCCSALLVRQRCIEQAHFETCCVDTALTCDLGSAVCTALPPNVSALLCVPLASQCVGSVVCACRTACLPPM